MQDSVSQDVTSKAERRARLVTKRDWEAPLLGLMFRHPWHKELDKLEAKSNLSWLEIYPENYMRRGSKLLSELDRVAASFPLTSHGVHLSLGGIDPLRGEYLDGVASFLGRHEAPWMSDHIGTTIHGGEVLHEILPVPFSATSAKRIAARMRETKSAVGLPLLVENTAYYVVPPGGTMTEPEFITEVLSLSDGELLLDVNNLYVNACNHGQDPVALLNALPLARVREIHIGGFTVDNTLGLLVDSHAASPTHAVFALLAEALRKTGPKPVLLEWETQHGSLDNVFAALDLVEQAWWRASGKNSAGIESSAGMRDSAKEVAS